MKTAHLLLFVLAALLFGCSTDQSDEAMLERDRQKMAKSLDSFKLTYYRAVVVGIRASAERDTTGHSKALSNAKQMARKLHRGAGSEEEALGVGDLWSMYQDYRELSDFVESHDEDEFPTLREGFAALYETPEAQDRC